MSDKNKIKHIKNGLKRLKLRYFNLRFFNYLVYTLVIISCMSFIALKNDISIKGFAINDLDLKLSKLQDRNTILELDSMTKQSILALSSMANELNMVNAGNINYIDAKQSTMAKK